VSKLEIKGRFSGKGEVEGEALVVPKSFGFWGATDQQKGVITDKWNPARGASFAHKILVIPSTKGSSGNWISLVICHLNGVSPKAIISRKADPLLVGACIELGIPYVFDLDKDPLNTIRTGDHVKVSVARAVVEIDRIG
jgi:predicted aconitase with swiveling domain